MLAFYKWNDDKTDETITIVSLDQYYMQSGMVQLPLVDLSIEAGHQIQVHDLITGNIYDWHNEWNYVELHPTLPFNIFKIKK